MSTTMLSGKTMKVQNKNQPRLIFTEREDKSLKGRDAQMKDLYSFQQSTVRGARTDENVFILDEQGLGKTIQALMAVVDQNLFPCLITAPTTNVYTWKSEIEKWFPSKTVVIETTADKGRILFEYFKNPNQFFIVAHPAFARANPDCKNYNELMESLISLPWKAVVIDEVHYFRNPDTLKAKSLLETTVNENVGKWFFLSGTPIVNKAGDLYVISRLSGSNIAPHEFDYQYSHSRYNYRTGQTEYYGITNRRELFKELRGGVYWRTANQIKAELPKKIIHDEYMEMPPAQRKVYDQLMREMIVRLDEGGVALTVQAQIAMFTRMRQLCVEPSSALGAVGAKVPSIKRQAVKNIIESSGGKAIVFSSFNNPLERIKEELGNAGISSVILNGAKVPRMEKRQQIVDEFNTTSKHRVLLMNVHIATGLSISGGQGDADTVRTVIVTDRWWNSVVTDQAIARAVRIDSKADFVNVHYLNCHDSIDQLLTGKNASKAKVAKAFFDYIQDNYE